LLIDFETESGRLCDGAADRSWVKPLDASVVPPHRNDPLARQLEHFSAVIGGEVDPIVSARDGCENLRITRTITSALTPGSLSISQLTQS
jgi:hypothetical protein